MIPWNLSKKDAPAPRRIFIAGGFADITGENCTVLAEEAVNVNALNEEQLLNDLKNLSEDLSTAQEEADKRRIQTKIDLAKGKLQALTGKAKP